MQSSAAAPLSLSLYVLRTAPLCLKWCFREQIRSLSREKLRGCNQSSVLIYYVTGVATQCLHCGVFHLLEWCVKVFCACSQVEDEFISYKSFVCIGCALRFSLITSGMHRLCEGKKKAIYRRNLWWALSLHRVHFSTCCCSIKDTLAQFCLLRGYLSVRGS